MPVDLSWTANITDPAIRSDIQSLCADGTLTRSAAITILNDVAARGTVTASEFTSLQTVGYALFASLAASDYVASLFTQLVFGNSMNASWTNGGTAQSLGNLGTGTSAAALNELIAKWFLGTDLPNPNVPQNLDGQGGKAVYPSYKEIALPLYGLTGLPSVTDVNQGEIGDCVVCATMIDLAANHPNQLGSMLINNGDGTYGVRFSVNGAPIWVTVNAQMPVNSSANLVFNNAFAANQSFWADVIEKAYATASSSGALGHPAVNSYDNINGNYAYIVLNAFTGNGYTIFNSANSNWYQQKQTLIADLANGDDLLLADPQPSGTNSTDSAGKLTLIGGHEFAVIGYDSATGNFILRNPWGALQPGSTQNFNTQFEVSMQQIAAVGGVITADNAAGLAPIPFNVVGALAAQQAGGISAPIAIIDSAADVAQSLDPLQNLAKAGLVSSITLSDGGTPKLAVTPGQLLADGQAIGLISGNFKLSLSGALTVAQAESLPAASWAKLAGTVGIADSAAHLSAGLDFLESMAKAGTLGMITPTDLPLPVLSATPTQISADAQAIAKIAGSYSLNGAAPSVTASGTSAIVELNPVPAMGPLNVRFVDNLGSVIGFSGDSIRNYAAFAWNGATPTAIATLAPLSGDIAAVAKMDNNAGSVVGYSLSAAGNSTPVVWSHRSGTASALPLPSNFNQGTALAINAAGDIAGTETANGAHLLVLWKNGIANALGTNGASTYDTPFAINSSDGIAGISGFSDGSTAAFAYQSGKLGSLSPLSGDTSSGAYGINDLGQVTGFSLGTTEHAALWQNGLTINLGSLASGDQSFASAIDNQGVIGGYDFNVQGQRAVIWVNGIIYDLNSLLPANSGWLLQTTRSVADVAQGALLVTGSGVFNHQADSYLLQVSLAGLTPSAAAAAQGFQTGLMTSAVTVSDNAADIAQNLDALQAMAQAGKLSAIHLTDGGMPVLSVTAVQFAQDSAALALISGSYGIDRPQAAANLPAITATTSQTVLALPSGNVSINGSGLDVLSLPAANASAYRLAADGDGSFTLTGGGVTDHVSGILQLQFADRTISIAPAASAQEWVALLYQAAFGRTPDAPGLAFWDKTAAALPSNSLGAYSLSNLPATGAGTASIAANFTGSSEFHSKYGALSDAQFIAQLYANVLDRSPDSTGQNFWQSQLASGMTREQILVGFADSAEAITHATQGFVGQSGPHAAWLLLT